MLFLCLEALFTTTLRSVEFFYFGNWLKSHPCSAPQTTSSRVIPHFPPLYTTFFSFSVVNTTSLYTVTSRELVCRGHNLLDYEAHSVRDYVRSLVYYQSV